MSSDGVDDSVGTGPGDDATDEVEKALRRAFSQPATFDELAGWDAAAAGYRSAVSVRRSRRLRLVAGIPLSAAAATAMLVPAGAVAAAYTGRLPAHVQHWVHKALAPIGVPAHRHAAPSPQPPRHSPPPTSSPYAARRVLTAPLPARQHDRAVTLCVTLSRTAQQDQRDLLTSLHRLLPHEPNLHEACRTLLQPSRTPAPRAPSTPRRSPAASPRPLPSPSAVPTRTPSPRPSASPSPSPSASSAP